MVGHATFRVLKVLAALNVILAIVVIVVRVVECAPVAVIAPTACYGLGFAAMFVSCVREVRQEGAGRPWMVIGGLLLLTASVLYFLA